MKSINLWTQNWANTVSSLDCIHTAATDSTNLWAKNQLLNRDTVLLTDTQSAGKGRGTNSWSQSKAGDTLLSTWFFIAASPQPVFAARLGLALYESLSQTWQDLPFSLKAPNDIYLGEGKLAGILVELEPQTKDCCFYVGVGLNAFSSPEISTQKTAALADHTSLSESDWLSFCSHFYQQLQELKRSSDQSQLSTDERAFILQALNKNPKHTYQDLLADGSLIDDKGSPIHWQDL